MPTSKRTVIEMLLMGTLTAFFPAIHAQAPEHAPTVDQCRADAKLWTYELLHTPNKDASRDRANLPFNTLAMREHEMAVCMEAVDPMAENPANDQMMTDMTRNHQYLTLRAAYAEEMGKRMRDFIVRKNLNGEFLAEEKSR
jgi:hypothetical protein